MDWGQILGFVLPSGSVAVGATYITKSFRSAPYLEARVSPKVLGGDARTVVDFTINVFNRQDRPLDVTGYEVQQKSIYSKIDFGGEVEPGDHDHQPRGADAWGRVPLDLQAPPFLTGMLEWPSIKIEGRVELTSYSVTQLTFVISAPHTFLGMRREKLRKVVHLTKNDGLSGWKPPRPRLESPRA